MNEMMISKADNKDMPKQLTSQTMPIALTSIELTDETNTLGNEMSFTHNTHSTNSGFFQTFTYTSCYPGIVGEHQ